MIEYLYIYIYAGSIWLIAFSICRCLFHFHFLLNLPTPSFLLLFSPVLTLAKGHAPTSMSDVGTGQRTEPWARRISGGHNPAKRCLILLNAVATWVYTRLSHRLQR